MVNVDIDKYLYNDVKKFVREHRLEYPSVKFFVQKAVSNEILYPKNKLDDFEKAYTQLKKLLDDNRFLLEEIYSLNGSVIKKRVLE